MAGFWSVSLLFLSIHCIQYKIETKVVKLNIEVDKLNLTDQFIVRSVSVMFGLSVYCVDCQSFFLSCTLVVWTASL
jgi:hypothetical protein